MKARRASELRRSSDVALDASLRSAARRGSTEVERRDLRVKLRDGEAPTLVVFAIDASASMRAHGHIATARGLISSLFGTVRRQRDFVSVVAFRDETADVVVPPTDDPDEAASRLETLPVGNKTPLAHGLFTALRLVQHEREADPDIPAIVIVMTDGRPTVAIEDDPIAEANRFARLIGAADVDLVVLDMDTGTSGTDVCKELAAEADGEYVSMFDLPDAQRRRVVTQTVQSLRSKL